MLKAEERMGSGAWLVSLSIKEENKREGASPPSSPSPAMEKMPQTNPQVLDGQTVSFPALHALDHIQETPCQVDLPGWLAGPQQALPSVRHGAHELIHISSESHSEEELCLSRR